MENTKPLGQVILIFSASILICIVLFILNSFISFGYGSFNGFLAELRNPPKEEKLESLRADAINQLTQAHAEFSSLTGITLYEKTYSDMCAKGEHGWKREDSYAYICSYRLTYYYRTSREYKELLLDVDKTVNDLGWIQSRTPKQPTIGKSISQHPGEIYLAEFPFYTKKISDNYRAENICLEYYCKRMNLAINGFDGYGGYWTKSSEEPDPFGFGIGIQQQIYKDASNKSPEEIFTAITSSGQDVIMISISKVYFEN